MSARQAKFRFVDDDGNESSATFLAALNTNITRQKGQTFRVRVQIDTTGDEPATQYRLEWRPVP